MADTGDLRALLAPLDAVLAARPRYRTVPGTRTVPDPTPENPDPAAVVTAPRVEAYTDPADLPAALTAGGGVDLAAQVALLQGAVAQLWGDLQIRTVTGRVTLTDGAHPAGSRFERGVVWDTPAGRVPGGAIVSIQSHISWQGRVYATVTPGALSEAGCTVTVHVLAPINPDSARPVTIDVTGLYLHVPGAAR